MLKPGDTAYFRFLGDWTNGRYKNHYCLPAVYYAFMPLRIDECRTSLSSSILGPMCVVNLNITGGIWNLSVDCIEKEFSFDKFILAQIEWGKSLTPAQVKRILSTIGR